jgi:hypothetical protein
MTWGSVYSRIQGVSKPTTWYLDCCTATSHQEQRLLLTNYDLGVPVPAKELQLGLDFNGTAPELFGGQELGEDALLVLNQNIVLFNQMRADLENELPQVQAATKWVAHVVHRAAQDRGLECDRRELICARFIRDKPNRWHNH